MADTWSALTRRRNPYLEALLREGLSSAPVQSHWQGVSRLAHGLLAGAELHDQDRRALAPEEAQDALAEAQDGTTDPAAVAFGSSRLPGYGDFAQAVASDRRDAARDALRASAPPLPRPAPPAIRPEREPRWPEPSAVMREPVNANLTPQQRIDQAWALMRQERDRQEPSQAAPPPPQPDVPQPQVGRDPWAVAARWNATAARPPGGRQEGWLTENPDFGMVVPRTPLDAVLMLAGGPLVKLGASIVRKTGIMRTPAAGAADQMARLPSKNANMYDPPAKSPRPFEADYPHGARSDATGRLTHDIEGRPLIAERVVGRRGVGGVDEALSPAESYAVATRLFGAPPQSVPQSALGRGTYGRYVRSRGSEGPVRSIDVLNTLNPVAKARAAAHEIGHGIEDRVGRVIRSDRGLAIHAIPQDGLKKELQQVYSTLATGQERTRRLTLPQHFGYRPKEVPAELMAEALRAYMTNPNYFKTVAPKTAAAIRQWVNSHPEISKIIQFNSVAVPLALTVAAGAAGDAAGEPPPP